MKDSAKLLHFNCNRELNFDTRRGVSFDIHRDLLFNHNRDLLFDVNRDLGIRKRGVVFRGYVCPVCGAPVARDAAECDECFVRFKPLEEKKTESEWSRGKKVSKEEGHLSTRRKKTLGKHKTFDCPVCGNMLHEGATVCPDCGLDFTLSDKTDEKVKRTKSRSEPQSQPVCHSCGFRIPRGDRFCRRCGNPVSQTSTTVDWDEYKSRGRGDGLVSWEVYSSNQDYKEDNGWS